MHSLVDSCMCPGWGSNPQSWCVRTTLPPPEPLARATLRLLIGAVSPLTFKVITDRLVRVATLQITFWLFLSFFSVPFFLSWSLPWWFAGFLYCDVWVPFSLLFLCTFCRFLVCGHCDVYIYQYI